MVSTSNVAWRGEIMKTTPCPELPCPPWIIPMICCDDASREPPAEEINYLSCYLCRLHRALNKSFPYVFYDMKYGNFMFPDKTLDYGEMKHDGTNLHINIAGTDYTDVTWESPMRIYHYYNNAPTIYKWGTLQDTISEAWASFDAAPVDGGEGVLTDYTTTWSIWQVDSRYIAKGREICLVFDTSSAPSDASTITLTTKVDLIRDDFGDVYLKLYKLDEAFSTSHWRTGGDYVTQKQITSTGNVSIDLTIDDINTDGYTRFRCTLPEIVDNDQSATVKRQGVYLDTYVKDYTYLTFTK